MVSDKQSHRSSEATARAPEHTYQTIDIVNGTIEKYLTKLREVTSRPGIYAYRGQADSQWPLHSTATRRLIREYGDKLLKLPSFSNEYLKYHRETLVEPARARGFDLENGRKVSDLQLLAKLQHFGAATGLLDFTWSPLVALWFASHEPECEGQLFVVNTRDPIHVAQVSSDETAQSVETVFSREGNSPRLSYWEPMLSGDAMARILRQRSVFIIGHPLVPEDTDKVIRKISIAKDEKESLLQDLELLDTGHLSLFLDLYGFSETESTEVPLRRIHDPSHYFRQGNQFYQQGDYPQAIETYSKCIELEPEVCEPYFLRGNAKAASGHHKEAIEDFDKAVSHKDRPFLNFDPNTTKLIYNPILFMVYYNRANAKAELKNYKRALKDYTDAINSGQGESGDSCLYFNRANTYVDLGKFKEAVTDYNKAIEFGPDHDHAFLNKGNTLVVMGCFAEALRCYREFENKGRYNNLVADNRRELERVIDEIGDSKYECHWRKRGRDGRYLKYGTPGILSIEFYTYTYNRPKVKYYFQGSVGNTGNFGGNRLSRGKGYLQKPGFGVKINRVVM